MRGELYSEPVSSWFTGRQTSLTRELPGANEAVVADGTRVKGAECGGAGTHKYWVSQAVLLGVVREVRRR